MNEHQAQQLIEQLFTQAFNLDQYQQFRRRQLNHLEPRDGHYTGSYFPLPSSSTTCPDCGMGFG